MRFPARTRWLKEQLNLTDLPAGLPGIQAMVQGCLAPQRGDDFPGGLPEQPVVDVRPHPAAHRPGDVQSDNTTLLSYAINFGAYIEGSTTASSMPGKA
jgi:hypothetical protein